MAIVDRHPAQPIEEILEDLLPRIQHVFSKFHIPPQDAENVLQQTLLTYLYKRAHILDAERWLMGTLRNRCLLYWRDRRRHLYTSVDRALLESVAETESSPEQQRDLLRDLNAALARIPNRCGNLLWSRYRHGFEPPSEARQSGARASSVHKVTERCLAALTRSMVACGLAKEGCDD